MLVARRKVALGLTTGPQCVVSGVISLRLVAFRLHCPRLRVRSVRALGLGNALDSNAGPMGFAEEIRTVVASTRLIMETCARVLCALRISRSFFSQVVDTHRVV